MSSSVGPTYPRVVAKEQESTAAGASRSARGGSFGSNNYNNFLSSLLGMPVGVT